MTACRAVIFYSFGRYLISRYSVNAPQVYTCLRKKPKCRYMGTFSRESVSSTTAG